MSTRKKGEPAIPYSPKALAKLHAAMATVNTELDAGAGLHIAPIKVTAGRRRDAWIPRNVRPFIEAPIDMAERLLATIRDRDAYIAHLEIAFSTAWSSKYGTGDTVADLQRTNEMLEQIRQGAK